MSESVNNVVLKEMQSKKKTREVKLNTLQCEHLGFSIAFETDLKMENFALKIPKFLILALSKNQL